ncbi:MAG: threonine ammonia-lyase [Firmicutes bacterium]|nr:threonine ammonia-lyase [Bacillota bacterium]
MLAQIFQITYTKGMALTFEDVLKAQKRIADAVHKTSQYYSETFSKFSGNSIYLKTENLQKTGSFKARGAYNMIAKQCEINCHASVITASAGNHAQGVAYSASKKEIESTIVMPTASPIAKIMATSGYGANVILHGDSFDDAYSHALELAKTSGASFIPPFNNEDIIAGQATVALEMLADKPDLDMIIVPVGGGGLLAGVAFIAKHIKPSIKIIGVQANKADAFAKSFVSKKLVALDNIYTIADGIAVKKPGNITLEYILKYADDVLTVSDDEIAETVILLMERAKLFVEASGATSVALACSGRLKIKNKNIGCILSGGNIDVGLVHKIIERGLRVRGRKMKLSIVLLDKPGSLEQFTAIMAKNNANIISVQYDRANTELTLNETILHIEFEPIGLSEGKKLIEKLKCTGYKII